MTLRAMIRTLVVASLTLLVLPATALAGPAPRDDTSRPLVYVFVVDALDGDRVDQGRAPFLSSLLAGQGARATYYRESRSIMVAETNPNHVAMATGAYGKASGIPGNEFAVYGPPTRENGCPLASRINESQPPTTTSGETPACIVAETFFQTVARSPFPNQVTTAGIFGKPKLGRLFAARRANGTLEADYLWAPCEGEDDDPSYCADVPNNPINGTTLNDGIVMDEILRSVREGVPADGARKRPNMTFANLPNVDTTGHILGAGSAYDGAIGSADAELRRFVTQQRALGLWRRTVMIVLSDHSMDTTPVRTSLATTRFTPAGIDPDDYTIVQNGSLDLVYLNDRTSPGRFELLRRMRAAALGTVPGPLPLPLPRSRRSRRSRRRSTARPTRPMAARRTRSPARTPAGSSTARAPATWSSPTRSGARSATRSTRSTATTAGRRRATTSSRSSAAGRGVRQATRSGRVGPLFDDTLLNPGQAENVDVSPTVMRLLGRRAPQNNSGRFLAEAFDLSAIPGGGRPAVLAPRIVLTVDPRTARVNRRTRFVFRARAPLAAGTAPCAAGAQAAGCAQRAGTGTLRATANATVSFAGRTARTNSRGIAVITTTLRSSRGGSRARRARTCARARRASGSCAARARRAASPAAADRGRRAPGAYFFLRFFLLESLSLELS